jgi:hypothetical protein
MVEIKYRTISEPKETTRHVFRKRSDDKSRACIKAENTIRRQK